MERKVTGRRDPMRVFDLLARLGQAGTEDEICERVMAAAIAAGVDVDGLADGMASSAPCGSKAWRRNRAAILSAVVADLMRRGNLGCLVADAGGLDGDRPTPGTRSRVLAWADAHSIDVSNDEADDLVRRLRAAMSDAAGTDTRDGDDKSPDSPDGGRHGLVPTSPADIPDAPSPDDDRAPGMAVGEDGSRAMRFDDIYASPVAVMLNGERAVALHPPYDGRIRVRPERRGARAVVVALDDLDPAARSALRAAPIRRRIELTVRCRAHCGQAFRAFMSPPSARGGEIVIEDTRGERICGFGELFTARCPAHRRGRRDGMSVWELLREMGYRGRRQEVCAAVLTTADMAGIDVEAIIRSAVEGKECPAWDSPEWGRLHERAVRVLVKKLRADGNLDAIRPQ